MKSLDDLYRLADENGICVDWRQMNAAKTLSMLLPDGTGAIAMDVTRLETTAEHKTALGHDMGHCATGSFYNRYSPADVKKKHENRADKWAIRQLISPEELDAAVADGHLEMWDLAEYFGVTEEFMRKAVSLYTYGNVNAELYF